MKPTKEMFNDFEKFFNELSQRSPEEMDNFVWTLIFDFTMKILTVAFLRLKDEDAYRDFFKSLISVLVNEMENGIQTKDTFIEMFTKKPGGKDE